MAWLRHSVTAPAAAEPITLANVKEHCRISGSLDDVALTAFMVAARNQVENRCGVKLINQTVLLQCSCWSDLNRFNIYPLQSVTSIKYLDESNVEQTLDTSVYQVVTGRSPSIYIKPSQCWPATYSAPDAIRVSAVFGFGPDGTTVPEAIINAMYLMIAGWSENRESLGSNQLALLPNGVDALLADYQPVC